MTRLAELVDAARAALNRNDALAAESLARDALALDSRSAPALHLAGVTAARLGRVQLAAERLQQAITADPTNLACLHDFAELCYRTGQLEPAADALSRAIALAPARADLPVKLGFVRLRQGGAEAAIEMIHRALAGAAPPVEELAQLAAAVLAARPALPAALHAAGLAEFRAGRTDRAFGLLRQAADAAPDAVPYWIDLAQLCFQLNRYDAVADALSRAIAVAPARADLLVKLALVRLRQQRPGDAMPLLRQALTIDPASLDAQVNLANLLSAEGSDGAARDEARRLFEQALAAAPNDPLIHSNYGSLLARLGRRDEAVERLHCALALAPDNLEARLNLAQLHQSYAQYDEAAALFRAVLERQPDHAAAHRGLGHVRLAQGHLAEGWREYHHRFFVDAAKGRLKVRPFQQSWWSGQPLAGKRIVAWAEQGIGEELMYSGLIAELVAEAAGVVVECDSRLVPLVARSFPKAAVVVRQTPPDRRAADPAIDFQCPFGGIAGIRRTGFDRFPRHAGYLVADPAQQAAARAWLESLGPAKVKLGISWFSDNRQIGDRKSTKLALWTNLLRRPDIVAVDLQYGDTADERAAAARDLGIAVHRHPEIEQLADLDAFAALVDALDLVITISNTTAHMAGALGKPCWVLLHDAPFWHWFLDRDDSPWYPSVRLFRQQTPGDWPDVFRRIESAFANWTRTRSS